MQTVFMFMHINEAVQPQCSQGVDDGQSGYGHQDDHLKTQQQVLGAGGDGTWSDSVTRRTKTTTRTYTDSDGTLITEVSCRSNNLRSILFQIIAFYAVHSYNIPIA